MKKIIIGITGASGHIYTKKLIEVLISKEIELFIICSTQGEKVFEFENKISIECFLKTLKTSNIKLLINENLFESVASGSYIHDGMIVAPCSMNTVAHIAHGISDSLLTRAADVCLKEKRKLVLLVRETPLSTIHLQNLTILSSNGVTILPATPGFYNKPITVDDIVNFIVGKILDAIKIDNDIYDRWES